MKLVVAGSRSIADYAWVSAQIDAYLGHLDRLPTEIVSGTAQGVDTLGERYAAEHHVPVKRFPAEWAKHGKKAGYLRNKQMAEYADAVLVLWDGKSRGSKHMYNLAVELDKPVRLRVL